MSLISLTSSNVLFVNNYYILLPFLIIVKSFFFTGLHSTICQMFYAQVKFITFTESHQMILIFYINTFVAVREKKFGQDKAGLNSMRSLT